MILPIESDQPWLAGRAQKSLRTHLLSHGSSSGGSTLRVETTPAVIGHHSSFNNSTGTSPLPLPYVREHRLVAKMSSSPCPSPSPQPQVKEVTIHVPTTLPTAVVQSVIASKSTETFVIRFHRIVNTYDLGNFTLLLVLLGILGGLQLVSPHHRLIVNPNEPEINYPHLHETVPTWLLFFLAGLLPVAAIFGIFFYQSRYKRTKREVYYILFGWALSMVITLLLTEFIKRITGRPRPNFIQLSGYNAVDGTYSGSEHNVANAYQSFPSGHSSVSFSGLGYLSLYLFRFVHPSYFTSRKQAQSYHRNQGWKSCLCFAPIFLATWIAVTRITDYWHSYDDVVSGALIGIVIATVIFQVHAQWWWQSILTEVRKGKCEEVQMCEPFQHAVIYAHERDLEAQLFEEDGDTSESKSNTKMDHQSNVKNRQQQQQQQQHQQQQHLQYPDIDLPITPPGDTPLLAVNSEKTVSPNVIEYRPYD